MTILLDWLIKRLNDRLSLGVGLHIFECLRHSLAGDSQTITMQQARIEQHLHQRTNAADGD